MRKDLRKRVISDWSQILVPWVAAVVAVVCVWRYGSGHAFDGLLGAAVVLAGFSVAAFNLRFRLIDSLQKWASSKAQVDRLSEIFKDCRKAIDWCIILFAITATFLGFSKVIDPQNSGACIIYAGIGYGLFAASLIEFLKILKSFRALEDFTLDMIGRIPKTEDQK